MTTKRVNLKQYFGRKYISITSLDYSNSETRKEVLDKTAKLSKKNNCYKLLIDARPLKKYPSITSKFKFGENLVSIDKLNRGRIDWITDDSELADFISSVANNRGLRRSIFYNIDQTKIHSFHFNTDNEISFIVI